MDAPATTSATPRRWKRTSTTSPPCSTACRRRRASTPRAFSAEESDFVRLNRGKVRQPGSVAQRYLDDRLDARAAARHAPAVAVRRPRGGRDGDRRSAWRRCAPRCPISTDDPHLLISTEVRSVARRARGGPLPPAEDDRRRRARRGDGLDLVGIYAGGPVCRGFANSLGQRNWHEATSFNLQWSLYHRADKAVKSALSGFAWDGARVRRAGWRDARDALAHIAGPPKSLAPGELPRVPHAGRDGGDRRAAVLGRLLGARARHAAEPAVADAGDRRRRGSTRASSSPRRRRRRRAGFQARASRARRARR